MCRVIGDVKLMYRKDSVTIEDWLKNSSSVDMKIAFYG